MTGSKLSIAELERRREDLAREQLALRRDAAVLNLLRDTLAEAERGSFTLRQWCGVGAQIGADGLLRELHGAGLADGLNRGLGNGATRAASASKAAVVWRNAVVQHSAEQIVSAIGHSSPHMLPDLRNHDRSLADR